MHGSFTRPTLLLFACCGAGWGHAQLAEPATVRVAVLSLFHPQELVLSAQGRSPIRIAHKAGDLLEMIFSDGSRHVVASFSLPGPTVTMHVEGTRTKLTRTYHGALTLTVHGGELRPVVTLDTETAIASVVAAEAPPGAPLEALKAQAIAARSFLLANLHPRSDADTCDTTHCQLLREAPQPGSPAWQATRATAHLVLGWRGGPSGQTGLVPAQWTATCAGQTLPGHPRTSSDYPFYPVVCAWCRAHPDRWRVPEGTPVPVNEAAREAWNRHHPDQQVPSMTMTGKTEGEGRGHGMGLCQRGASALALQGRNDREILAHYFPNTMLMRLP